MLKFFANRKNSEPVADQNQNYPRQKNLFADCSKTVSDGLENFGKNRPPPKNDIYFDELSEKDIWDFDEEMNKSLFDFGSNDSIFDNPSIEKTENAKSYALKKTKIDKMFHVSSHLHPFTKQMGPKIDPAATLKIASLDFRPLKKRMPKTWLLSDILKNDRTLFKNAFNYSDPFSTAEYPNLFANLKNPQNENFEKIGDPKTKDDTKTKNFESEILISDQTGKTKIGQKSKQRENFCEATNPTQSSEDEIRSKPFTPNPTTEFYPIHSTRRKQTARACVNCVRAKAGCDKNRPCRRCIRLEKQSCVDRKLNPNRKNSRNKYSLPLKAKTEKFCNNTTFSDDFRKLRLSGPNQTDFAITSEKSVSESAEQNLAESGNENRTDENLDDFIRKKVASLRKEGKASRGVFAAASFFVGNSSLRSKLIKMFGGEKIFEFGQINVDTKVAHFSISGKDSNLPKIEVLVSNMTDLGKNVFALFDINRAAQDLFKMPTRNLAAKLASSPYSVFPKKEWPRLFEEMVQLFTLRKKRIEGYFSVLDSAGNKIPCFAVLSVRDLINSNGGCGVSFVIDPIENI
ncbi:hypothetical protein MHBO_001860 [Bonamia ostreae]|uniref:Zn(2)-C6 fungal-type domain-containing protein n=1 Tax=Bonamia ostreae TaxID=126728 RepID=A0ABV2AKF6_9EUKA